MRVFVGCALSLCNFEPVYGADVNWAADFLLRGQHQSNVALSAANAQEDQTIEARLSAQAWRKSEVHQSVVSIVVKNDNSRNFSEFEQDVYSLALDETINAERSRYSLRGEVSRSTTLGNGYESGEFVRRNLTVDSRSISGQGQWNISEYVLGQLDATGAQVRYERSFESDSQDYNNRQLSLSLRLSDSPRAHWSLSGYLSELNQLQSSLDISTEGITLSRNYKWSEVWSLSAKLGRRTSHFEAVDFIGGRFTQSNTGRVSSFDIKHTGDISAWGVAASEDISPRANGIIDETQRIGPWWERRLSSLTQLKLNATLVRRTPINTPFFQEDSTRYTALSSSLAVAWSETISTDVLIRYVERSIENGVSNSQADGLQISMGMRWQLHP